MSLGHDILSDLSKDDFDPRGTDICPECGSGHTYRRVSGSFKWYGDPIFWFVHYHCGECFSKWWGKSFTEPTSYLTLPNLSDRMGS